MAAEEEGSWRDTLFVWDGILTIHDGEAKDATTIPKETSVSWEGTWVGCENCANARKAEAPKRGVFDAFVDSDMHFLVEGTATKLNPNDHDDDNNPKKGIVAAANVHRAPYQAMLLKGDGWDLQDGKTKSKHKDTVHNVLFSNLEWSGNLRDQRNNLVFAKGKNNHGSFISAGWMRPGNRVTLGRRYLEDKDSRMNWTLEELKTAVLGEILKEGKKIRLPPWQCAALHAVEQDTTLNGKKRKHDDEKEDETSKQ